MTYWQAKDEGREYGPFATLLEAMQSMQADDGAPELNEASRAQLGPDEEKRCTGRARAMPRSRTRIGESKPAIGSCAQDRRPGHAALRRRAAAPRLAGEEGRAERSAAHRAAAPYRTSSTGSRVRCRTFIATEPIKSSPTVLLPWRPITIASQPRRSAWRAIVWPIGPISTSFV